MPSSRLASPALLLLSAAFASACGGTPAATVATAPHPAGKSAARPTVRGGPPPDVPGVGVTEVASGAAPVSDEDLAYLRERELFVPVAGVRAAKIGGSFDEDRSGGRTHHATDILAARGTPVVAADEGRVWKVQWNRLGGNTVYVADPLERFVYYYAHLERYREGLAEGAVVAKGDTLGYVGTTGNAPPDVPHLHFQAARLAGDGRYWAGTPVDVLPFLKAADRARLARTDRARADAAAAGARAVSSRP